MTSQPVLASCSGAANTARLSTADFAFSPVKAPASCPTRLPAILDGQTSTLQRSTKGDQTMRIPTLDIDNTARNEKPTAAPKLETVGQMLSAAGTIVMCLLALGFLAVLAWIFFA